ncbi:TniQ family protein [Agrobacterium rhizogenes]|nr:TniQ family protein [Rhizobium rhizogenes]
MTEARNASCLRYPVEIRERYREVSLERWPVSVSPLADELLSSWLHRVAIANGAAPASFAETLGQQNGMWSARLDLAAPSKILGLLADRTGFGHEVISRMSLRGCGLKVLLLPLRHDSKQRFSTWIQYCPDCFASDESPYFRRAWRLATRISCFVHRKGLRDRCPSCRSGIASFAQPHLIPQHICAVCGFDLRRAPKMSVMLSARRLERSIEAICSLEVIRKWTSTCPLLSQLLRVPKMVRGFSERSLTSLSSAARRRCFERLSEEADEYLLDDDDWSGSTITPLSSRLEGMTRRLLS